MVRVIVPKLRFKEFEDDWKSFRLNDISIINPKNKILPEKFIYIDLESVNKGILTKKNIIDKKDAPSRAQRTVLLNDILFQTVRPYQQNNYFINELDTLPYIASTGYALIRTSQIPYFIYTILYKKTFLNKVLDMCTGTSFPAINSNDLGTIDIRIPEKEEQIKISNLLSLLDKKIELQKQKIEALKLYKIYLLKNVFNNTTLEKLKLKEICTIKKGQQYNNDMLLNDGKYYMLNGGINPSGYLNECNSKSNTISISEGGNSCGYINYNKKPFWSGGHCYTLTDEKINNEYLFYLLKYNQANIMRLRVGSGLPNIQKYDLENFEIHIHTKDNHKNIAEIFKTFDFKIKIVENKLSYLNKFKKSMLQKLFI